MRPHHHASEPVSCDVQRQVGHYRLQGLLGRGGMGEVYLAHDERLGRPCAVKLIRADRGRDAQAVARFQNEVRAAVRVAHPNVVEVYDHGVTDDGQCYYAMELLQGPSLQELVEHSGPLSPGRVIRLLRQIGAALAAAHRQRMVHRDVKPANIVVAAGEVAKLLDFGLVKFVGHVPEDVQMTRDGLAIGSPLYAAPELVLGDSADPRTDVYSLGATAYFLLTGRPVFTGIHPLRIAFAHATEPPTRPSSVRSGIPADLEAVVLRCLAKAPEGRFGSIAELDAALAACADDATDVLESVEAPPAAAAVPDPRVMETSIAPTADDSLDSRKTVADSRRWRAMVFRHGPERRRSCFAICRGTGVSPVRTTVLRHSTHWREAGAKANANRCRIRERASPILRP